MLNPIPFVKMHGLGNDYVYIDELASGEPIVSASDAPAWAQRLSDRHRGVGGDGLILLRADPEHACRMEMYNADGSRAEMCGNGIRCVARLAWERRYARDESFTIATDCGPRPVQVVLNGREVIAVRVGMGLPEIQSLEERIDFDGRSVRGSVLTLGNPHFVIELDEDPKGYPVAEVGGRIEVHPRFPRRTNVEFAHPRSPSELDLRVWERGSGETQACGTGATAAVAALARRGRLGPRVVVHLRGGDLSIDVGDDGSMGLTGPAEEVFQGSFPRRLVAAISG